MSEPKIALVHDYLIQNGGAERVLKAVHDLFPTSTVFTSSFEKNNFPEEFQNWDIKTSGIQKLPLFNFLSKHYTLLYPMLFESFDLREFDIVISSWSAWSKSVLTNPRQLHVSYCHTPPRFLYKYATETSRRDAWYYKPFVSFVDLCLRIWDYHSAQRPDFLIANSQTVQKRIKKFYGRESTVIFPPVRTQRELVLSEKSSKFDTNYYLMVTRLAAYKNVDLAIKAFNYLGLPLRIVGTGKEETYLKSLVKADIAFMGRVDDREQAILFQNCKGLISPISDEDFGIVPIEALSFGKPVLSHRSGGITETIEEGKTGMFFDNLTEGGLIKAVSEFDSSVNAGVFDSRYLKESAKKYDEAIFKTKFWDFVFEKWEEKMKSGPCVLESSHA